MAKVSSSKIVLFDKKVCRLLVLVLSGLENSGKIECKTIKYEGRLCLSSKYGEVSVQGKKLSCIVGY